MDPQREEHLAQNLLAADHVGSDKYEQLGQEQPPYRDQRAQVHGNRANKDAQNRESKETKRADDRGAVGAAGSGFVRPIGPQAAYFSYYGDHADVRRVDRIAPKAAKREKKGSHGSYQNRVSQTPTAQGAQQYYGKLEKYMPGASAGEDNGVIHEIQEEQLPSMTSSLLRDMTSGSNSPPNLKGSRRATATEVGGEGRDSDI